MFNNCITLEQFKLLSPRINYKLINPSDKKFVNSAMSLYFFATVRYLHEDVNAQCVQSHRSLPIPGVNIPDHDVPKRYIPRAYRGKQWFIRVQARLHTWHKVPCESLLTGDIVPWVASAAKMLGADKISFTPRVYAPRTPSGWHVPRLEMCQNPKMSGRELICISNSRKYLITRSSTDPREFLSRESILLKENFEKPE